MRLPIMVEIVASTAAVYLFLLGLLRVSARRQLGQLTAIDLVLVLTLGSAVEVAMIHGDTSLGAGFVSATTLLVLNRGLTQLFLRSDRLRHLVNGGPVVLVHDGHTLDDHLRRTGLTRPDLVEALRTRGYDRLAQVRYAVLEVDGSVTVVPVPTSPAAA